MSKYNNTDAWNELGESPKERDKRPLRAYCSSNTCHRGALHSGCNGTLKKGVSDKATFCPDCGNALFWQRYNPLKVGKNQASWNRKQSKKYKK